MISVMAHPTTAGVLASFASLGDVTVAEPGALHLLHRPARRAADDPREAARRLRARRVEPALRPPRRASSRGPSCAATSARLLRLFGQWPGEAEVRLRERLSSLSSLPLLRGARLSGELERLQRQLDRISAEPEPTEDEIWQSVELARHERAAVHARLRRAAARGLRRAARRPHPRRRPGDRRRPRPLRGPHGRADRPPEGPRHQGAHAPQLRHGRTRRATARRCA